MPRLLVALDLLEESRASHLDYREVFARRRRREKAKGQRTPTKGDLEALARREWQMDLGDAAVRHPATASSAGGSRRLRHQPQGHDSSSRG